jgi:hypothetical protein
MIVKNDLKLKSCKKTKSSRLERGSESCKSPKMPTVPCLAPIIFSVETLFFNTRDPDPTEQNFCCETAPKCIQSHGLWKKRQETATFHVKINQNHLLEKTDFVSTKILPHAIPQSQTHLKVVREQFAWFFVSSDWLASSPNHNPLGYFAWKHTLAQPGCTKHKTLA